MTSARPSSSSITDVNADGKKLISAPTPNLVLPTWDDTFHTPPRSTLGLRGRSRKGESREEQESMGGNLLGRTMKFVSGVLFGTGTGPGAAAQRGPFGEFGKELPKAWGAPEGGGVRMNDPTLDAAAGAMNDVLRGCRRVVVIGVHGWFPGTFFRTVLRHGEPTGTSTKFADMAERALQEFEKAHGVKLEKITKIPLEGEGTIEGRVQKLYTNLKANEEWMADLHAADAILVAAHSQGTVVSTHLLDGLLRDGHVITSRNPGLSTSVGLWPTGTGAEAFPSSIGLGDAGKRKVQRICLLALCGIHLGPLRGLKSHILARPYLYLESVAARELFEFQDTNSKVSQEYVKALENVLDHGTKVVYIASLDDQVVPIYSGLFTAASHPLILRALYIDGDAYHSSDFLSNLIVLLLRILNSGMSDSGLLVHLSEATAGSLTGVGHSTAYEELATYSLAIKYLFLSDEGVTENAKLRVEPFSATHEQNDYEIPWSLRHVIADESVAHFFWPDIADLRDAFPEWHPKTSILRDLKRKLQPIQRLSGSAFTSSGTGVIHRSKL